MVKSRLYHENLLADGQVHQFEFYYKRGIATFKALCTTNVVAHFGIAFIIYEIYFEDKKMEGNEFQREREYIKDLFSTPKEVAFKENIISAAISSLPDHKRKIEKFS